MELGKLETIAQTVNALTGRETGGPSLHPRLFLTSTKVSPRMDERKPETSRAMINDSHTANSDARDGEVLPSLQFVDQRFQRGSPVSIVKTEERFPSRHARINQAAHDTRSHS